jgi:uncharacterized membrane protein YphA (DoxX/SURF4 family)
MWKATRREAALSADDRRGSSEDQLNASAHESQALAITGGLLVLGVAGAGRWSVNTVPKRDNLDDRFWHGG